MIAHHVTCHAFERTAWRSDNEPRPAIAATRRGSGRDRARVPYRGRLTYIHRGLPARRTPRQANVPVITAVSQASAPAPYEMPKPTVMRNAAIAKAPRAARRAPMGRNDLISPDIGAR